MSNPSKKFPAFDFLDTVQHNAVGSGYNGLSRRGVTSHPRDQEVSYNRASPIQLSDRAFLNPPQREFDVCSHAYGGSQTTYEPPISRKAAIEKKFGVSQVYGKEHFIPGLIINANHFEEAWNQHPSASYAETLVIGKQGERICTKRRYLIVVAQNESCYTTVPIYTFNGHGLQFKRDRNEYVSIRDHNIPPHEFQQQSEHKPLVTEQLNGPVKMKIESTAWVAYAVSRNYSLPVTISGFLNTDSTNRLVALHQKFMASRLDSKPVPLLQRKSTVRKSQFHDDWRSVKSVRTHVYIPAPRHLQDEDMRSVTSMRSNSTSRSRSDRDMQKEAIDALFFSRCNFADESQR